MASTKCHVVDHVIDGHAPRAISYRLLLSDGQHRVSVTSRALGCRSLLANNAFAQRIFSEYESGAISAFLSGPCNYNASIFM